MKQKKLRKQYPALPDFVRDVEAVLNSEPTFTVTLTSNTASTVVSCALAGKDSFIGFMPTSVTAAAEQTTMSVTSRDTGTFTIEHSSGASTRTFVYFVWG